ncbi:MAG: transglutaminase-like domain-containing protein [Clostridiales bacterium]|nr:transglutaminase-like domain-containing protein [Clostridiales bacterium]
MKELCKEHAYPCCLVWLLCVGVITSINAYLYLGVNEFFIGIFALVFIVLIRLFDVNKKNAMPYAILAILILIIAAILYYSNFSLKEEFSRYQIWLNNIYSVAKELSIWYSIFTIGVLLLISSLIFSILVKKDSVRVVITVVLFISLILCSIFRIKVSKFGTCCLLTYLILNIIEIKLNHFYEKSNKNGAKPMPFLLSFFLLFMLGIFFLPMKQTPIEWKFVKQCISTISNTIEGWIADFDLWRNPNKIDFSVSFTGFTEDGEVGGSLKDQDSHALHIVASNAIKNNIYLSGNMKNYFDGTRWTNEFVSEKPKDRDEFFYDVSELLYAIDRAGSEFDAQSLYSVSFLDITYEGIHTRSLFCPAKTIDFISTDSDDEIIDDYDGKRFTKAKGRGTKYRVNYMNLNLGSKYFDDLVKSQETFRYSNGESESAKQCVEKLRFMLPFIDKKRVPENFEQQLYERAAYIRQNYTKVYDTLPQRVRELALEVTKDCTTDYEKLIALENYLGSYTYTKTPKQPPEGEDFIDYLLFESHEGYCSYYATAFAVMARCLNIPTRYVQGFCVATRDLTTYQYDTYNRDAHAWVEAYIEGIGWLPFEPTPTYNTQRYQPWTYEKKESTRQTISQSPSYHIESEEEKLLRQQEEIRNRRNAYKSAGAVIGIILLIILISIPMYFGIKFGYLKRRYEKSSIEGKVYSDIWKILYIFECCHRKREHTETFSNYMESIYPFYPQQAKQLREVENIFHSLRYNNRQPSSEEQLEIAEMKKILLKKSKSELNMSQYLKLRWHLLSNSLS